MLFLAPEPPYPLHGGGAFRTASLIHYFARFAAVDLILFSESGEPALLPEGLVRKQTVIRLPKNGRSASARWMRNARRALRGVPPLVDRLRGFDAEVIVAIGGQRYDLGVVEHSWCGGYGEVMAACCAATMLDLHNIESVLHERCAMVDHGFVGLGHRRFAGASRQLEKEWFPSYSSVLVASDADRAAAGRIAPGAKFAVYPNSIPTRPEPDFNSPRQPVVVFSGNFEYHPNVDAVGFLTSEIWPLVRRANPQLRLRLVGRGNEHVEHLVGADSGIEMTGPVEDAMAEIAEAAVGIAPLRTGSGTRLKILEAWAVGCPVVATPLAAEGLDVTSGQELLLAEKPADIASAIVRIAASRDESYALARAAYARYRSAFTWESAWRKLDNILGINTEAAV